MRCAICGRPTRDGIYCTYGYCSQNHLERLNEVRRSRFEAVREEPRAELPPVVSEAALKRHLLRLALERIWAEADGDPVDYDDDIPEMWVRGLMGRVLELLPGSWAGAFDRAFLDPGLPREVAQRAIEQAFENLGRRKGDFS